MEANASSFTATVVQDTQGTKQSIDPLNLVKRSTRVPIYNLLRDAGESGKRAHL